MGLKHQKIQCILYVILGLCNLDLVAQQEPLQSQYMNNQLSINPGYAGVGNSLATSIWSRNQWLGVEGAPTSYALSIHSPFNDSYASIGTNLFSNSVGPLTYQKANICYSYLIKFNSPVMLSLGLSASASNYSINSNELIYFDADDQALNQDIDNKLIPNAGFGAFLFTPTFYIGLSIPEIVELSLAKAEDGYELSQRRRHYYLSSGIVIPVNREINIKPSAFVRYVNGAPLSTDISAQLMYKKTLWTGFSYRLNSAVAFLANFQINENLSVGYSYDYTLSSDHFNRIGSHEITLTFESFRFYKNTQKRRFNKRQTEEKEEGIKSIRYF